ncbi:Lysophospholipid acyltransferase [Nymphaea thermarum]|nr:Lysophospholipid acyltransferase [Nymphaea thermarum]
MVSTEMKDMGGACSRPPESGEELVGDGRGKDEQPLLKPGGGSLDLQELEKKYAPYVRHDVYGIMGRGELPLREKLLLPLALVTLVPLRLVLGIAILVVYYLICRLFTLFSTPNREDEQEDYAHMTGYRRAVVVRSGRFLSRALLFAMGFYWISEDVVDPRGPSDCDRNGDASVSKALAENDSKEHSERAGAIVSNHVSYLDILYHMSSSFPSFVAKRSVARLPLVGLISKCLGCVYVQRESKSSDFKGVSGVVTERIQAAWQNGHAPAMLLFPEGTTTNGDYLLPFKTGAFLPRCPVLPVIVRYPYTRFSPAWESMSGVRHVILLLCQFVNYIHVVRLPIYYPTEEEKNDPKLYADNVRRFMAKEGNLILSDIGLAEKRTYHAALHGNSLPSVLHHQKGE